MKRNFRGIVLPAIAGAALIGAASCIVGAGVPGTFDRTYSVDGPVRLELVNSGGMSVVSAGATGEVRVHADFRVHSWSDGSAERRKNDLMTTPPISQQGNVITVGELGTSSGHMTVNYTMTVPASTQIHAMTGSGSVSLTGIEGPVNLIAGSGRIAASDITQDV